MTSGRVLAAFSNAPLENSISNEAGGPSSNLVAVGQSDHPNTTQFQIDSMIQN